MLQDASEAQKEINVTVYLLGPILHFLLNKNIVKQGSGVAQLVERYFRYQRSAVRIQSSAKNYL